MKRWLKKWWPDTLYRQLLLAMLLCAVIWQGTNFYAVCFIQRYYDLEVHKVRYDYNSSIFLALQGLGDDQRELFLRGLAKSQEALSQPFQFEISQQAPAWDSDGSDYAIQAVRAMSKALTNAGADTKLSPIKARVVQQSGQDASQPLYRESRYPQLQIIAQIDDGRWLTINQPLLISNAGAVWRQRQFVLLESLIFSIAVIILVRRTTRPLYKLSLAAEKFGRNPETVQPLPEYGSREIRIAFHSFNLMRERICNSISERSRMLSAMAHDLRSPLARIQVRMEKIKPDVLREQFAANINEIQSIIQQGIELAKSLNTSEKLAPLDLIAFIESIVDDLDDQGLAVSLSDFASEQNKPLLVMARPTCLRRCFENILENALKYGHKAEISISRKAGELIIEVADSGPGIPEEFREKVFEPYYRLETSRNRAHGGIGLGLSIAKNMALLNNGGLSVRNKPGGGLIVSIILPYFEK